MPTRLQASSRGSIQHKPNLTAQKGQRYGVQKTLRRAALPQRLASLCCLSVGANRCNTTLAKVNIDAMRVRLLLCAAAAAAAPAWLREPGASCLPDPFEGLDDSARENAEIAATALDATTVWTLDAADAARFDHARAATFGHITAGGAHALLAAARRLADRPVSKLVDLGSGAGHVVIYAAALAPNVTATGHELAAGRHRAAMRARAALPSSIARRCVFVEGDMLRADLSRADMVFASTLALGEELRSQLAEKLAKEVLPGAVVFSSTRLLGGPGDRPHVVAPMSWSPGHEVAAHVVGAGTFVAV